MLRLAMNLMLLPLLMVGLPLLFVLAWLQEVIEERMDAVQPAALRSRRASR